IIRWSQVRMLGASTCLQTLDVLATSCYQVIRHRRIFGEPKQEINDSGGMVHTHTQNPLLVSLPKEAPEELARRTMKFSPYTRYRFWNAPEGKALEVEPQPELNDAPTVRGVENHAE